MQPSTNEPSVGELVKQATEQLSGLVRAELKLAVTEVKEKGQHAGKGAGMFGGAAVLALYGLAAVLIAIGAALALVLPVWAAALIVGVVLFAIAGILGLAGKRQVAQAVPPVPAEAMHSIEQDVNEIKARAHR